MFGRIAVVLTVACRAGARRESLVTRGLAAGRVPWGNMYEFVVAVTLVGSLGLARGSGPRGRRCGRWAYT